MPVLRGGTGCWMINEINMVNWQMVYILPEVYFAGFQRVFSSGCGYRLLLTCSAACFLFGRRLLSSGQLCIMGKKKANHTAAMDAPKRPDFHERKRTGSAGRRAVYSS